MWTNIKSETAPEVAAVLNIMKSLAPWYNKFATVQRIQRIITAGGEIHYYTDARISMTIAFKYKETPQMWNIQHFGLAAKKSNYDYAVKIAVKKVVDFLKEKKQQQIYGIISDNLAHYIQEFYARVAVIGWDVKSKRICNNTATHWTLSVDKVKPMMIG